MHTNAIALALSVEVAAPRSSARPAFRLPVENSGVPERVQSPGTVAHRAIARGMLAYRAIHGFLLTARDAIRERIESVDFYRLGRAMQIPGRTRPQAAPMRTASHNHYGSQQ